MSSKRFSLAEAVPERSTYVYSTVLTTPDGDLVQPNQVNSILLTLRDVASDTVVNDRAEVEVKNANGGTLTEGLFAFQFDEADTVILGTRASERRVMTLDFRLTGGRVTRDVEFYVRNLRDISA